MTHTLRVIALAAGCAAAAVSPALAQAPPQGRGVELAVGASWTGPTSFGTSDANLLNPSGGNLTLFSSDNDLRPGYGLEVHLAKPMGARFAIEGSGTLTWATLRSRISADFEGAEGVEVTERLLRFTAEGSAVWTFADRGKTSYFVRGGAGWLRELAGDGSYLEDGLVINAGGGLKYWMRDGARRRVGIRVEGRVQMRQSGVSLGSDKLQISPVLSGGLLIGF